MRGYPGDTDRCLVSALGGSGRLRASACPAQMHAGDRCRDLDDGAGPALRVRRVARVPLGDPCVAREARSTPPSAPRGLGAPGASPEPGSCKHQSARHPVGRRAAGIGQEGPRKGALSYPRELECRGLLRIGRVSHLASCEARRVVGRRMPSLIGLTSLLFRVREYAQPVGAGPIRGPALIPRRRMPSLIGLTSLLFRVREYAQPVGAGPIRGPALIPREVGWPRTHAPSSSP